MPFSGTKLLTHPCWMWNYFCVAFCICSMLSLMCSALQQIIGELLEAIDMRGTATAAPPPFRPGNPALCGSHPLVTPYYCRLGDLLCFVFIVSLLYFFSVNCCVFSVFLQYFDTVGWVFWPVKTVARITYTVLVETLNPAQSINQATYMLWVFLRCTTISELEELYVNISSVDSWLCASFISQCLLTVGWALSLMLLVLLRITAFCQS